MREDSVKPAAPINAIRERYEKVHGIQRPPACRDSGRTKAILRRVLWFTNRSLLERIDELLGNLGGTLFDAGCGRGELLLSRSEKFHRLIGCDFSVRFLLDAERELAARCSSDPKLRGRIQLFNHDLNLPIPLPTAACDVITAVAVLEHVFDVYGFLRELHRLLKPGGTLIVQVPNSGSVKQVLRLIAGRPLVTQLAPPERWPVEGYDGAHLHYFTFWSLALVMRQCGFRVVYCTNSGALAQIRQLAPSLLAGDILCKAAAL